MNHRENHPMDKRPGDKRPAGKRLMDRREGGRRSGKPANGKPRVTSRDVALRALEDVTRRDAYAAQALDRRLEEAPLSPEDRRLAAGIFYFAVENRLYIDFALAGLIQQKPEAVVENILHVAAAQILFMDRVPDHAAVDEAVKQTRQCGRSGLTGLVNGVLRNLIRRRDGQEIVLPSPSEDAAGWLSVRRSVAPAAARRLIDAYGLDEADRILGWTPVRRELTIRPNRMRTDVAGLTAWLDERRLSWRHGTVEDAVIVGDAGNLAASEGYRRGLFSIQGQSAMLAAQAVQAAPGMQILDACAAPGGKSCLMAERMGGSGRVYAWDVHPHRVELIRAAAKRLGLDNVRPSEHDAQRPLESLELAMDAVLVDAPCSGLGVIGEKPDIKYRQSAESLDALPPLQSAILEAASRAVKVNGLLVYATCTILPGENENQVRAFLARHPQFVPEEHEDWLPVALRGRLQDGMLQLLPHRDGLEGFFIARMRRKGV